MALSADTKNRLKIALALPAAGEDVSDHIDSVAMSQLDNDVVKYVDVTLTTAQCLALNTTPIEVIPAPGAGLVVLVQEVFSSLTFVAAAYSWNAAGLSLNYTDGSGASAGTTLTQAYLQSSASAVQHVRGGGTALTPVANAPIVAFAGSADPTTGDSAIKLRIYYKIVPSPLA